MEGFFSDFLEHRISTIFLKTLHKPLKFISVDWETGINYFADLRMTFRQNFFLKDKFRNKLGVGLG
jgi:hypothetical protein